MFVELLRADFPTAIDANIDQQVAFVGQRRFADEFDPDGMNNSCLNEFADRLIDDGHCRVDFLGADG